MSRTNENTDFKYNVNPARRVLFCIERELGNSIELDLLQYILWENEIPI
jgi:hypothetical protein